MAINELNNLQLNRELFETIHTASVDILASKGFRFDLPEVVEIFKSHGFKTEDRTVYFTGQQVEKVLEQTPSEITILAREPRNNLHLSLDSLAFGLGRGAVFTIEPDGQGRNSTAHDFISFTKLSHVLDEVEHWQPLVTPQDLPLGAGPAFGAQVMLKFQNKPDNAYGEVGFELVRLAFGRPSLEQMREKSAQGFSFGQSTVNPMSPFILTETGCRDLLRYAGAGLATQITPMPLTGSTGPCTMLGLVVQNNCEVLAPLVLAQLITPGCPIIYGNLGSGSDMRTMLGAFGSPESRLIENISGGLAKHYGLLARSGVAVTDSGHTGYQAGAEAMLHILNAKAAGTNLGIGLGYIGGYMAGSLAKLMLDVELVNYAKALYRPLEPSPEMLAAELIKETGFGGNYLTTSHTLNHCRSEHYTPALFERPTSEHWRPGSSEEFSRAAHNRALEKLAEYQPPALDPAIEKEMDLLLAQHLPPELIISPRN